MLTTLWVLAMAGVLATTALVAGRNAAGAARNRVEWTRAHWRALGCVRRAQAAIDSVLSHRSNEDGSVAWRLPSVLLDSSSVATECRVTLEAAGARLDINSATPEMLESVLAATGRVDAPELAGEIVALREQAPIPDVHALRRIDNSVDWGAYDSLLSVEPGRIPLSAAPAIVLEAIPGFSPEIASAVVAHRASHGPVSDLSEVLSLVSRGLGRELEERFQEASRVAVADPDAWLLRSVAQSGNPPISAVVSWRLTRQGRRVIIARTIVR